MKRCNRTPKDEKTKEKAWPDFAPLGERFVQTQSSQDDGPSKPCRLAPALYVVSTPIGNAGDITLRALWTLAHVDAILCEDTRVSGVLLRRYGIKKPLFSCHEHNEAARAEDVLSRLAGGQALALVSDAGTPLISDPGLRVVRAVRDAGFSVFAIPGASALMTALACVGLPTDRFLFAGFLPAKASARSAFLESLRDARATLVFYESPRRLAASLAVMKDVFSGARRAVVARELTKLYEDIKAAPLEELVSFYNNAQPPKGEVVVLVEPAREGKEGPAADDGLIVASLQKAMKTMSVRDAAAHVSKALGARKSDVYQKALSLFDKRGAESV